MPLQLPDLDDRTYDDLVQEALALIPAYAPEWTNHNPSDPGITLVELFAYLSEMLIYRLNRVTDTNVYAFLKLINGPEWEPSRQKTLADETRDTVLALREPNRAITCEDFEHLALEADPQARVKRARCVPRRNLASENILARSVEKPAHVSVVIVPGGEGSRLVPTDDLIQVVADYLEPRRLITTRVHVVGPRYFSVGVRLTLVLKPDALEAAVRAKAVEALQEFLHPLTGGLDGRGWPFGRSVYVSEIYALLDMQPGVDYITETIDPATNQPLDELTAADPARLRRNALGELEAVEIQPDELVDAKIEPADITLVSPVQLGDL
jgi:hypothetical protein